MENQQYAGFGVRFVATIIDNIIYLVIGWILSFVTDSQVINILVAGLYSVYFWVKQNGQTPGKKAMNIRVIRADGKPIDWMTGILRYIGYFVSLIPLFLGFVWILFDAKKQGWHDKIAGTYVVKV